MGLLMSKLHELISELSIFSDTPARILMLGLDGAGLSCLIYVVDSSDRERLQESREVLYDVLAHKDMIDVPFVVLANKQDIPGAMEISEVAEGLGLTKFTNRKWYIRGACALKGHGLYESMALLADVVTNYKKEKAELKTEELGLI